MRCRFLSKSWKHYLCTPMNIACVVLITGVFCSIAYATEQNVKSIDLLTANKEIILYISKSDARVSAMLSKFKDGLYDIDLINQLQLDEKTVYEYVEKNINGNISQSELLLIMQVLSLIDSPKSITLLLSIGEKFKGNPEVQIGLLELLSELAESKEAAVYFDEIFKNNRNWDVNTLRAALLSVSISHSSKVSRVASYYRSPGISSDVRFIGLYMSSLLGKDKTLKRWILKILLAENKPPAFQHYYLLIALSRQMSDVEFNDFLSRSYVSKVVISSVKTERLFYQGDADTRLKLASNLINSNYADQRNTAISFLLKEQGFEKTWQQLNQQQRLSAIRLSYKLSVPFVSRTIDESFSGNYLWYVFTLGVILLIVFTGFRRSEL